MVIWVKFPRGISDVEGYSQRLTYDSLREALQAHAGTHTLQVDLNGKMTAVIPSRDQLVVAEIPAGMKTGAIAPRADTLPSKTAGFFFMDNRKSTNIKTWLFMLRDTAQIASNGAITEAGDDILSAAKFTQLTKNGDKLSSVFFYDTDRGMSVIKDEGTWSDDLTGQFVSAQQGYLNMTSFGAVEYWQKPADLSDITAPTANISVSGGQLVLELSDDQDLRYLELHVQASDGEWITVTRDFVLESCMKNGGRAVDTLSTRVTLAIENGTAQISYYATVLDGNGNISALGSAEAPLTISAE